MIRSLHSAELPWFVARSLAFVGHVDPNGLAQRLAPRLREPRRDAATTFVWQVDGAAPSAGVVAIVPEADDDERTLRMAQPWFDGAVEDFGSLVAAIAERVDHEAVVLDLAGVPVARIEGLQAQLAGDGFDLDVMTTLRFDLAEVPPLGLPLALEAWSPAGDAAVRELVGRSEGWSVSERRWAYAKRAFGPFRPDLWFTASEAPDRPAVGYALCGARSVGVDATYGLIAAGVTPEHRGSTEMLRRVLLTLLHELAGVSPVGRLETVLSGRDPKLIEILRSLGFSSEQPRPQLRRLPG